MCFVHSDICTKPMRLFCPFGQVLTGQVYIALNLVVPRFCADYPWHLIGLCALAWLLWQYSIAVRRMMSALDAKPSVPKSMVLQSSLVLSTHPFALGILCH